ncbi:MAG: hypothetical protein AAGA84_11555 [Pseudomonadota bacterium]
MRSAKQFCLAFFVMMVVWILLGFFTDFLSSWLEPSKMHYSSTELAAWTSRTLLLLNVLGGFQTIVTFAAGAFVLRRRAFVPAIILWILMAVGSIHILHEIAVHADPSVDYWDVVLRNPIGWISSFLSVLVGVLLGEFVSRRTTDIAHPV